MTDEKSNLAMNTVSSTTTKSKQHLLPIRQFAFEAFSPQRAVLIANLLKEDVTKQGWWTTWYTSNGVAGLPSKTMDTKEWLLSGTMPTHVKRVLESEIANIVRIVPDIEMKQKKQHQQQQQQPYATADQQLFAMQLTQCAQDWNLLSVLTPAFRSWVERYCSTTARLLWFLIVI